MRTNWCRVLRLDTFPVSLHLTDLYLFVGKTEKTRYFSAGFIMRLKMKYKEKNAEISESESDIFEPKHIKNSNNSVLHLKDNVKGNTSSKNTKYEVSVSESENVNKSTSFAHEIDSGTISPLYNLDRKNNSPEKKSIRIKPESSDSSADSSNNSEMHHTDSKFHMLEKNRINVEKNSMKEEITSDDEIWTVQCPKDMHIKGLIHQVIDITEGTINSICDKYTLHTLPHEKLPSLAFIIPQCHKEVDSTVTIQSKGHIIIRRNIEIPNTKLTYIKKKVPKFPKDLGSRHPLLGSQWKEHTQEVYGVLKKFRKQEKRKRKESELKRKRKESEHKRKRKESENELDATEEYVLKKKKKKKIV